MQAWPPGRRRISGILLIMKNESLAGYREVEHAADWELEVWAPDLVGLLEQAARGMYALCGMRVLGEGRQRRELNLPNAERERLLVTFLNELLYLLESEGLGFDGFDMELSEAGLRARLAGGKASPTSKEIKAITYHKLQVRQGAGGLRVNIVLDV
ncbi:MAG: archease [Anaerolineales bacterium]|nr:archease [Anaerolineales bacterium]